MRNAKEEFLKSTMNCNIIAAVISVGGNDAILYRYYTQKQYESFLDKIDVEYDDGFGCQELFGTIWCSDNIWFDRGEYDGSEWWQIHQYPYEDIPKDEELERKFKMNTIIEK